MKGLLYKDYMAVRTMFRNYIPITFLFIAMGAFMDDGVFWSVYGVFFGATIVSSLMAHEEQTKWNETAACLPLTSKVRVSEKYVLALICIALFCAVYLAAGIVNSVMNHTELSVLFSGIQTIVIASETVFAATIPLTVLFGVQKSGLIRLGTVGIIAMIGIFILNSGRDLGSALADNPLLSVSSFAVMTVLFVLSWLLAMFLSERKLGY